MNLGLYIFLGITAFTFIYALVVLMELNDFMKNIEKKMIKQAIKNALLMKSIRGWDTLYWSIDLHGVVLVPNYDRIVKLEIYPTAAIVMRALTKSKKNKLIMYTASKEVEIEKYVELFAQESIKFYFLNKNTDVRDADTNYGAYENKPYFNILLEDKAGFDPYEDWDEIYNLLPSIA